jgi:hypothetical protein
LAYTEEIEEIRARMKGAFATIYLTLLSIIQGVALAVLFSKVDSLVSRHAFHAPQAIMAIGIFLVIVAVWNQYQMGVMLYTWTASIVDAIIPFTLGVTEFWMVSGLDRGASAVLFADGLLLALGFAAFEYQYYQVRRTTGTGAFVHRLNRSFRAIDGATTFGAVVVAFGAAAFIARSGPAPWSEMLGAFIVVALALGHLAREVMQWRTVQQRMVESSFSDSSNG